MNITESYISRAECWMLVTILIYFLMNGAQIFETLVWVPKWTANPPESLTWLSDTNGVSLKTFWIVFHSIHELTFLAAIIFCWKLMPIRNALLILFAAHVAVRIWTLYYFAPSIIEFQHISESVPSQTELIQRANLWKKLNFIRVGAYLAISIGLVPLLLKLINWK